MTSDKTLKNKAIDIKGKKYVLVSDRVAYFNETYPKGSIITNLVSEPTSEMIIVQAIVRPDSSESMRQFTGYSQAVIGEGMVNKTAALENAETSAVGRALGMMGIGVIESIASADEIHKASINPEPKKYKLEGLATDKQKETIKTNLEKIGVELNDQADYLQSEWGVNIPLSKEDASSIIDDLFAGQSGEYNG
jgi:hypothetical protein